MAMLGSQAKPGAATLNKVKLQIEQVSLLPSARPKTSPTETGKATVETCLGSLPFLLGRVPTKIDYRKKGTLILTFKTGGPRCIVARDSLQLSS